MTIERWLPVVGHEGAYEISDQGRVWSWLSNRMLKLVPAKTGGYPVVNLRGKVRKVHHLELEAFVGPRPLGDIHGRHWDDDPTNNQISNLLWGTRSENFRDAVRNGRHVNARKTRCKRGHEFTPENTGRQLSGRFCRECVRRTKREWEQRKKGVAA